MKRVVLALALISLAAAAGAQESSPSSEGAQPAGPLDFCLWNGGAFSIGATFCVSKTYHLECDAGDGSSGSARWVAKNNPRVCEEPAETLP